MEAPADRPPSARATETRRARVARGAGVLALFALLTGAMTWPLARDLDRAVADLGDPLFKIWTFAWVAHQLPRDPAHLFDANIFVPERFTLAFSDTTLLPALAASVPIWLGLSPLLAYNLVMFAAFVLAGACTYLLVSSLLFPLDSHRRGAALFAGIVFAFWTYRYERYPNVELELTCWIPLTLWALHRTLSRARLRDGLLTGGAIAGQALSSLYYGVFLCTYLVPVGLVLLAGTRWSRRLFVSLAAGATLAALLILPAMVPYFHSRTIVGERPRSELAMWSAELRSFGGAPRENVIYGPFRGPAGPWHLFPGLLAVGFSLVAIAAAVRPRAARGLSPGGGDGDSDAGAGPGPRTVALAYAAGLIVAVDATIGTHGVSYPWLYDHVLPYRGLRVPVRFAELAGFSLAVLGGLGLARVASKRRARRPWMGRLLVAAACAGALVEYRATPLKSAPVWRDPPPVYAYFRTRAEPATLLELPAGTDFRYLYFSTTHWQRLVNGYSGFLPASYIELLQSLAHFPDEASLALLRARGVGFVIVHGAFYREGEYADLLARIRTQPALQEVGVYRWRGADTHLYRLAR